MKVIQYGRDIHYREKNLQFIQTESVKILFSQSPDFLPFRGSGIRPEPLVSRKSVGRKKWTLTDEEYPEEDREIFIIWNPDGTSWRGDSESKYSYLRDKPSLKNLFGILNDLNR